MPLKRGRAVIVTSAVNARRSAAPRALVRRPWPPPAALAANHVIGSPSGRLPDSRRLSLHAKTHTQAQEKEKERDKGK